MSETAACHDARSMIRSSLVRYGPDEAWSEHEHDEMSISVVLGGNLVERVGRREEIAALGSFVIKPAKSVHSNQFGSSGAVFLAIWPGSLLTSGLPPKDRPDWRWRHDLGTTRRWVSLAQELEAGDRWGAAEEEVAALLEPDGSACPLRGEPPVWLKQIRDKIHALQPERPSVARLARAAGLHPVYLTRSFRHHYGSSISAYVRRLRIQRAAAMLIGKHASEIVSIAHELGFADQSHFNRTFLSELGVTPGAYRRIMSRA